MPVVDDDFPDVADCSLVNHVVGGVIAAVPGSFVIHQHLNLALARGVGDGVSVLGADRQRLFHHDRNTVAGAYFDHLAMIVGIGVGQNGLRMSLLQHFFQVGEQQTPVEVVLRRIARSDLLVSFGDAYHLDLRPMQRSLKKSVNVSVNQSGDSDPERPGIGGGLGAGSREHHEQEAGQEHCKKIFMWNLWTPAGMVADSRSETGSRPGMNGGECVLYRLQLF